MKKKQIQGTIKFKSDNATRDSSQLDLWKLRFVQLVDDFTIDSTWAKYNRLDKPWCTEAYNRDRIEPEKEKRCYLILFHVFQCNNQVI